MKLFITGDAGLVGSGVARAFKQDDRSSGVMVVDNLKRRGTELTQPLLKREGIDFYHGDVPVSEERLSSSVDIALYISDYGRAAATFDWLPHLSVPAIVADISRWIQESVTKRRPIFDQTEKGIV